MGKSGAWGELGSITLTLSSLPPCSLPWLSTAEVQPRLGQLPGSLLQALLHSEELGGCGDPVQALWGAPGHHPDPRRAGLHQWYVTMPQTLLHPSASAQGPSVLGCRF